MFFELDINQEKNFKKIKVKGEEETQAQQKDNLQILGKHRIRCQN